MPPRFNIRNGKVIVDGREGTQLQPEEVAAIALALKPERFSLRTSGKSLFQSLNRIPWSRLLLTWFAVLAIIILAISILEHNRYQLQCMKIPPIFTNPSSLPYTHQCVIFDTWSGQVVVNQFLPWPDLGSAQPPAKEKSPSSEGETQTYGEVI